MLFVVSSRLQLHPIEEGLISLFAVGYVIKYLVMLKHSYICSTEETFLLGFISELLENIEEMFPRYW